MDMAFPSLLLVSFVTGIYFLSLIPFPRGWMRWMAILVLCLICQYGAQIQNQALFLPRPRARPRHERGDAGGQTRLAKIILYKDDR
ncbi:hypothetical protein CMV_024858 [Castanea mollissima]|uniref:Uncharacterized protein n=1 Tax=Castanea mollissima TaxID=60419 RepID=A0A8J4QE45_9ROSI|nr:hypothetical protein CMV_024858 [Castanea mollissima]